MNDKQLLKLCKQFTKGALNGMGNESMCFAVSSALQGYLSICGINAQMTEGEIEYPAYILVHWWLTLPDGRIIDPTASQLEGKGLPDVYIGAKPDYYLTLTHDRAAK